MKGERNNGMWDFELSIQAEGEGQDLILGLDGRTTSTVCICMPIFDFDDDCVPPEPRVFGLLLIFIYFIFVKMGCLLWYQNGCTV